MRMRRQPSSSTVLSGGVAMPLVFVHGVKNRVGPAYQEAVEARTALFRRFALGGLCPAPDRATVLSPYWGGCAAEFRWNFACLPVDDGTESLGGDDPQVIPLATAIQALTADGTAPDRTLTAAAGADFPGTIDLLFAAGAVEADADADAEEFAEAAQRAAAYADSHPDPPEWLSRVSTDDEFLDRLQEEIERTRPTGPAAAATPPTPDVESLGARDLFGAFRDGAGRVRDALSNTAGARVYGLLRKDVVPTAATFFGDVFVYLDRRGTAETPGEIPEIVLGDLQRAAAAVNDQDPYLVVVGHSLGGVITYDLLTSFAPDLHVDAFVTVGSQVGLFEELKLFRASDPAVPGNGQTRVNRPKAVDHWLNVYDLNDLFSYRLEPIVEGVDEFRYATGQLLTAHGAYFGQPRFHQRLAERLHGSLAP